MMHSVLAAIQPIVFACNVKVRHVLFNMYVSGLGFNPG